jgi:hypothetical protein
MGMKKDKKKNTVRRMQSEKRPTKLRANTNILQIENSPNISAQGISSVSKILSALLGGFLSRALRGLTNNFLRCFLSRALCCGLLLGWHSVTLLSLLFVHLSDDSKFVEMISFRERAKSIRRTRV